MSNISEIDSDTFTASLFHFIDFLRDNKVFAIVIASILSDRINDLIDKFVEGCVVPVINQDIDGDGTSELKALENKTVTVRGIRLEVGKVFVSLLKFLIVGYFIFIVSKMFTRWVNRKTRSG